MTMKALFQRLDDEMARLEHVICIAGALVGVDESVAEPLSELLEEDEDTLTKLFGEELPDWLIEALDERDMPNDAFRQWALDTGHLGFAIQVATPVMTPLGEGSASYSWGFYRTHWVYADTFDAAVEAGLAWVEQCRERERRNAKLHEPSAKD